MRKVEFTSRANEAKLKATSNTETPGDISVIITTDNINEKLATLDEMKTFLKSKYVGIDRAIDSIVQYIIPWYVFPSAQSSPCIICLWGMTGCGKTSIVQDIVEYLDMAEHFMTGIDSYHMTRTDISPDKPLIVLFDELQNHSTKEIDGSRINDSDEDMWEFLSSGAVSSMSYYIPDDVTIDDKGDICNLDIPNVYYILLRGGMTSKEKLDILRKFSKKSRMLLPQALVFVCGNLDGIYPGARNMDNESDADQYFALSQKITLQDVRAELNKLFFPEHISRMGSNHVIFPAFDTAAYRSMILLKSENIRKRYEEISGRNIAISQNLLDHLYSISVVPSQGARPVASTVQSFLGFYVPYALCRNIGDITLDYDETLLINNVATPIVEMVRRKDIMQIPEEDLVDCIVHEAGHVVVALTVGLEPFSVSILEEGRATSNFNATEFHTPEKEKDFICMVLAGRAAQHIVLGDDRGSESDIERATDIACKLIRINGHAGAFSRTEEKSDPLSLIETGEHDHEIEAILQQQAERSKKLIQENWECFKECVALLRTTRKIRSVDMEGLAEKYYQETSAERYNRFIEMFGGEGDGKTV